MVLSQAEFTNEGDSILIQMLKQKEWSRVREFLHEGVCSSNKKVIRQQDSFHNTALHVALGYEAPDDILLQLIDEYPEATQQHGTGNDWLPLHIAAMYGASAPVVQAIIEAYPQALDDSGEGGIKGRTPRHFKDRFPHNTALLELSTEEWVSIVLKKKNAPANLSS